MPIVTVEKPLKDKLGDDGVDSLIHLLNQAQRDQKEDVLEFVENKFEQRLSKEISKVNNRITEEISKLDKRITEEITKLDKRITEEITKLDKRITEEITKFDNKIEHIRADIIKWMFIFLVGQVTVIAGLLFAFFK